jgi:hypothetical protein
MIQPENSCIVQLLDKVRYTKKVGALRSRDLDEVIILLRSAEGIKPISTRAEYYADLSVRYNLL